MKVLFIFTFNVSLAREHTFTIQVWNELRKYEGLESLEVLKSEDGRSSLTFDADKKMWTALVLPAEVQDTASQTKTFVDIFRRIKPDIIHSNMAEGGAEIEAARRLGIPAMTTIHIPGIICLKQYDSLCTSKDALCDGAIGDKCIWCGCDELPLSFVGKTLLRVLPQGVKSRLDVFFTRHQTFYFSRLFSLQRVLEGRKKYLEILRYAHPIAANQRLYDILKGHGCNPVLLRHGCRQRERLPYPPVEGKVKFFYIGRIDRKKGLHVLLDALEGIDKSLYELHVIGERSESRSMRLYFQTIIQRLKTVNGFYHGGVNNDELEQYVKDWHVMVHPAIYHEVYGLTISESLAWGRPVLSTKCCGPEMQIHDGEDGWLVPTNDAVALRRKIEEIISRRDRLCAMSDRCRLPVSMQSYAQSLYSIYNKVCEGEI